MTMYKVSLACLLSMMALASCQPFLSEKDVFVEKISEFAARNESVRFSDPSNPRPSVAFTEDRTSGSGEVVGGVGSQAPRYSRLSMQSPLSRSITVFVRHAYRLDIPTMHSTLGLGVKVL
jgi:hypothetical protein